jgi:hypothetical protein
MTGLLMDRMNDIENRDPKILNARYALDRFCSAIAAFRIRLWIVPLSEADNA